MSDKMPYASNRFRVVSPLVSARVEYDRSRERAWSAIRQTEGAIWLLRSHASRMACKSALMGKGANSGRFLRGCSALHLDSAERGCESITFVSKAESDSAFDSCKSMWLAPASSKCCHVVERATRGRLNLVELCDGRTKLHQPRPTVSRSAAGLAHLDRCMSARSLRNLQKAAARSLRRFQRVVARANVVVV